MFMAFPPIVTFTTSLKCESDRIHTVSVTAQWVIDDYGVVWVNVTLLFVTFSFLSSQWGYISQDPSYSLTKADCWPGQMILMLLNQSWHPAVWAAVPTMLDVTCEYCQYSRSCLFMPYLISYLDNWYLGQLSLSWIICNIGFGCNHTCIFAVGFATMRHHNAVMCY